MRLLCSGFLLALAAACGVARPTEEPLPGPAALPNLRRASEALQNRIQREKEHVESFNRQLVELKLAEERTSLALQDAEANYQRLQDDFDFAREDVEQAGAELDALRADLEARRAERDALAAELAGVQADLEQLTEALTDAKIQALEAQTELDEWTALVALTRSRVDEARGERSRWLAQLEVFRERWRVPPAQWAQLLGVLGVAADAPAEDAPGDASAASDDAPSEAAEGEDDETEADADATGDGT